MESVLSIESSLGGGSFGGCSGGNNGGSSNSILGTSGDVAYNVSGNKCKCAVVKIEAISLTRTIRLAYSITCTLVGSDAISVACRIRLTYIVTCNAFVLQLSKSTVCLSEMGNLGNIISLPINKIRRGGIGGGCNKLHAPFDTSRIGLVISTSGSVKTSLAFDRLVSPPDVTCTRAATSFYHISVSAAFTGALMSIVSISMALLFVIRLSGLEGSVSAIIRSAWAAPQASYSLSMTLKLSA